MPRDQLGRGVGEVAAGVVLEMPVDRDDLAQERIERLTRWDETLVQEPRVPVVEDAADVEDDGGRPGRQPWRALKRRFVLLMT
jgi:hypothetical protein